MDVPEKSFFDVLDLLKSWNPWRPEPTNVSRDFWMPDQSCRVCYECDSQFTLLNRRHHCRHCGRVFCAKCTSNWVPALGSPRTGREEWEKIRVCNFCFKQWEQGLATIDNGVQVASLDLSASPSVASLTSSKSSYTFDSNAITFASMPHSVESYQQNHPSALSPHRSAEIERNINGEGLGAPGKSNDHGAGTGNPSPDHFGFCTNRSDDDNDEFGVFHLDSEKRHFPQDSYYAQVEDDEMDYIYRMQNVQTHPDEETVDTKSVSSPSLHNSFDSRGSEGTKKPVEKGEEGDIGDECEATCSLYAAADVDAEPVDFENNGLLWLPPEPEDEDDEREALLYDDDDDDYYGDATGEWGYLRASSSFGSGEYRNRDRSNEEHSKAMKNVVNGHFKALIAQLLQVENFPLGEEDDKDSWLEIITSLSWEAATILKPDMSKGGGMDPGGYVKVKCLASGRRCESMVIKGVVCKKNVAHRRMPSRIEKPRLMILGGALEYQRVSNHLSSFDTLLQQEMDHLKMAVAKIDAHQPDVLLVEKSVSRFAQEYLLAKNISLVLNIKEPLLERISRCTGAQKVPSIDHLSSKKLGYCDMFHVERFLEEHGTAGQGGKKLVKTLMYFEGCPKPLGCTILLRGANGDELKKVKHVIHYAVFAAYHLALETSFLADEGASLPELPLNSPITVALPDKPSSIDSSTSKVVYKVNGKTQGSEPSTDPQRSNSFPTVDLVSSSFNDIEKIDRAVLPHSPDTPSFQNTEPIPSFANSTASVPSVAFSGQDIADYCHGKWPSNHAFQENCMVDAAESSAAATSIFSSDQDVSGGQLIANDLEHLEATVQGLPSDNARDISTGVNTNDLPRLAVCDMPSEEFPEDFPPSPSDHQGILVSLSSRCVWKGTVCENPHLFRIKYYGKLDKPLGRYLRDHLFDQSYRCQSCDMPAEAHVHCYTHRQGTLTISVRMLPEILLPGEREGKIWMWHRCLRCPRTNGFPPATRRIVMSDAAWGLSFGKFLEISFSDHAAASRVASCGHSLHRDCLRFYGYGKMVACFRYASIDVHSVYLPPHELDFNYENQDWIQKEMNEVVNGAELLFAEVLNALSQMAEKRSGPEPCSIGMKTSESRHQVAELKFMLQKEKAEFEESLQKILKREVKKGQPVIDILEINRLRRQLLFQSYMWDHRLVYAASSVSQGLQDDFSEPNLEYMEERLSANGNVTNMNMPVKPDKGLSGSDLVPMDVEVNVSPDHEGVIGYDASQHKVICRGIDVQIDSNHEKEIQSNHSAGTNICVEPDEVESNIVVHTTPSDTQYSEIASLSDSYDAAWTGKNHPGFRGPKADSCSVPESAIAESSAETAVIEKLEFGNTGDDQTMPKISSASPVLSTKGSDYLEESISWLRMPFINFYRSFNKNFLCSAQKLDTLGEYNPVYVSSFREMELQGGAGLLLPVGVNDTVVPVYDDEPTSIISYALVSPDYLDQLSDECPKDSGESTVTLQSVDSVNFLSFHSFDEMASESYRSLGSMDDSILSMSGSRNSLVSDPVSSTKALHARVSFADERHLGKVKYNVTCYYAKQFEALRRICCPSEMDFVRSISRCKKWGAQGGKSNVFFAKTLDDRFIIKQVTKTELESFIKFAPQYFRYLSHSIGTGSPTCLAKILGMYQITSKHLKGGKESKMDVLVMENLLFGRYVTRLYDLKGSSRSRYNPDSSGSNKVLLDQNLIEAMPTCPIFVGTKAKRSLERAVWNDTSFLASVDVMDYSLLVGVDEEKHQLVIGIIDFMRQYTWDKHLETWVKASGILGGPKNTSPTIISPKQYKRRFRKAMTTYFLMVPDQWCRPSLTPSKSQTELCEENIQGGTSVE
ncbi:1-phosphatidylinositol-3-phosphate 5-kinase FAB1B-like [Diospyros lotus]|uniref:1-phosphatidylinositol-3-phosphate 5-kinase FAB1B-like n=1 Tax=Diospyros lotus TaxID=55363 RepID=UPI002252EA0B|nr:1-phosphatidylinositol-3-phosphate 5-kinase FAB1B-like [Diospyros lotus]XP_052182615.1 1-phosphatidylinositol-3-phosphate 5-kinase FAB1B-like [Diospyros lotus]XP_052182616.1 1-phosphatidylinositol-3-phosphate 5-kinase FAB1B-like [Diospyros lotus]